MLSNIEMVCFIILLSPSWFFTLFIYVPIGVGASVTQMKVFGDFEDKVSLQIFIVNAILWFFGPVAFHVLQSRQLRRFFEVQSSFNKQVQLMEVLNS